MSALWVWLGGLAGILRMVTAAAIVAVGLIVYFVWLVIPDEREDARNGYVLLSRVATAEAVAQNLRDQLGASKVVIDAYQVQYRNSLDKLAQADAEDEARIKENEAALKAQGRDDSVTDDDCLFILRRKCD